MTRKWIKDLASNDINRYYFMGGKQRRQSGDGLTFVGCCGGHLYQKPIKKGQTLKVFGVTVCNRRVTGHNHKDVDKTIVNTSNGPITIFAVKEKNGVGYNV